MIGGYGGSKGLLFYKPGGMDNELVPLNSSTQPQHRRKKPASLVPPQEEKREKKGGDCPPHLYSWGGESTDNFCL